MEFASAQAVQVLNTGFSGYLLPVQFTALTYERRLRSENLDPEASQVFFVGQEAAGIVLVARRGWRSRIATMGIDPAFRGQGYGRLMLGQVIQEAKARGDKHMVLEVFETNTPAVRLYRSLGFVPLRRLVGYNRAASTGVPSALTAHDPLTLAQLLAQHGPHDWPWMLQPETLAAKVAPHQAFSLEGEAWALVQDVGSAWVLWAMWVQPLARRQGYGRRLLEALANRFEGKPCRVIQIVPENLAPAFFERCGFSLTELNQLEMGLDLNL